MIKECNDEAYQICGRVVVRQIGRDTLLVPVSGPASGGRVFPINESALTVWNALSATGTARHAADALVQEFGIDGEEALADSRECLSTFLNEGLIEERKT